MDEVSSPGKSECRSVVGWSGDREYFRFIECERGEETFYRSVLDVLSGDVIGTIYRGMVREETCAGIAEKFWLNGSRKPRGAEAPGFYVGALHYLQSTRDYLDASARVRSAVQEVLGVSNDPLNHFQLGLIRVLASRGIKYRLARNGGLEACTALIRSWYGAGEFALAPHEDASQCCYPAQADFEIQSVNNFEVVSLNICVENGDGGRLVMWNVKPDELSRVTFDTFYTGIPYPVASLARIERLTVDVHPGDVYVFNGGHVHAVEPRVDSLGRRITIAALLGFIDDRTVVSWT